MGYLVLVRIFFPLTYKAIVRQVFRCKFFSPGNQSPGYFFLKSPLLPPQKLNGRPLHRLNKEKINQPTHQSHLRLTIN